MSGNDSGPRRSGVWTTILILLGLALVGGAGWRVLRGLDQARVATATPRPPPPLAEGASGAGAPVVVQAPQPAAPPTALREQAVAALAAPPFAAPAEEAPAQPAPAPAVVAAPAPRPAKPEQAARQPEAPRTEATQAPAPKPEAPKPEAPKPEAVQTQAPQVEAPAPKVEAAKPEAPKAEAVQTQGPKVEAQIPAPKVEAVKPPAPKAETPNAEAAQTPAPKVEPAKPEAPKAETPNAEAAQTPAPKIEAAKPEAPKAETPNAEAAQTPAPKIEAAKPEAPKAEALKTEPPKTEAAKTAPTQPVQAEAAPAPVAAAEPTKDAAGQERPSFDIVRISPQGNAVVAGRAAPNADVTLLDNGTAIAHAQADPSGQWVALPDKPLPSGGQELTLAAREAGKAEVAGDAPVVLLVPKQDAGKHAVATESGAAEPQLPSAPLAVLTPPNAAPRVLQAPPAEPVATPTGKIAGKVGLDVVDYDERGAIRFAGTGAPGSLVRLYVDDVPVGDAIVDPQGRWGLVPTTKVAAGDHRLRVDDVGIRGQVTARVELPFQRALLSADEVLEGRVVVQPRQNLWRIARRAYGLGVRYTVIYEANREQIRNPDLIYPGQVFAVPPLLDTAAPTASTGTSASASKSR